ncbi:MAG TPA: universal stress protein [Nitrospiraceae bacterium]|nr:universal stress protein [Nitrospiraceae bacterium]
MRVVVAVDWSDQAFNAVQEVVRLYTPEELTLVHAVDLGFLEYAAVEQAMALRGYDDFRRAMCDAGEQLLDRTSALVPPEVTSVKRVCEIGTPARVIQDAVQSTAADLVVVGARGRGRIEELVLGSVSHRVLTHTTCTTLVVKRPISALRRVLLAVEGPDDSERLQGWLRAHPFNKPVELSVMSVVPTPQYGEPPTVPAFHLWADIAAKSAQDLVADMRNGLNGPHYQVTGLTFKGDPAAVIAREAAGFDLVAVSSHGRTGLKRFLLGSVSHSVVHRVACPVLVVR